LAADGGDLEPLAAAANLQVDILAV